ncbi:MAG: sulfur carrier protein ThiS [Bacteroidetes bacterium]|nr:sulfur carrier protein ThiS [Bacteroidota bacterium]
MEITINNQIKFLTEHSNISVQQLLNIEIPIKQKGIAIAVNNKVIPRSNWENEIISNKDNVLIIKATQGG